MIGKILSGVFKLIISLVNVLLSPIDQLIEQNLPQINDGLSAINSLIDYIINSIKFAVDLIALSPVAIDLIIAYFGFVLVVPLLVSSVKLAILWYDKLKI